MVNNSIVSILMIGFRMLTVIFVFGESPNTRNTANTLNFANKQNRKTNRT